MRRHPGFTSTRLHKAVSTEARFHFINFAEWESTDHFQKAIESVEFKQLTEPHMETFPHYPGLYKVIRTWHHIAADDYGLAVDPLHAIHSSFCLPLQFINALCSAGKDTLKSDAHLCLYCRNIDYCQFFHLNGTRWVIWFKVGNRWCRNTLIWWFWALCSGKNGRRTMPYYREISDKAFRIKSRWPMFCFARVKGSPKNNFPFSHLIFMSFSPDPHSQKPRNNTTIPAALRNRIE